VNENREEREGELTDVNGREEERGLDHSLKDTCKHDSKPYSVHSFLS